MGLSRLNEFQAIVREQQRRKVKKSPIEAQNANGAAGGTRRQRSEFARQAAQIGRGISGTMGKLQKLAQLASRKTLFDDNPQEINSLTSIIKQDLAGLTHQLGQLQELSRSQHGVKARPGDQEGQHEGK